MSHDNPFRILIAGGGIAGLALAHGLQRLHPTRPIQIIVLEKRKDESRFTGFPIHLAPPGRQALRSLLTDFEHVELEKDSEFGIHHGGITIVSSSRLVKKFAARQFERCKLLFVQRVDLKVALSRGVDVRVGEVVGFVDFGEGVRVLLRDGSEEVVDLLIGADGIGSSIRAKLHPALTRVPTLPYLTVSFKLVLSGSFTLEDPNGINLVLGRLNYTILLVPLRGRAGYIYAIATLPIFDDWQTTDDWQQRISRLLQADQAHPDLIQVIDADWIEKSERVWQDTCMDRRHLPPRVEGRVQLVGDAAHTMPPYGGVGASLALKDAQELCLALEESDAFGGTIPLSEALQTFHNAMMKRASTHLKDAQRRMSLSLCSGRGVYLQTAILGIMNLAWPVLTLLSSLPFRSQVK